MQVWATEASGQESGGARLRGRRKCQGDDRGDDDDDDDDGDDDDVQRSKLMCGREQVQEGQAARAFNRV